VRARCSRPSRRNRNDDARPRLALLADAAHNFGDVSACCWHWAAWLGRRHPTRSRTYGYGRSSILASLTNAVVLLVGVGGITVEAVHRLIDGVSAGEIDGKTVWCGPMASRRLIAASFRCANKLLQSLTRKDEGTARDPFNADPNQIML
jgi:Cation efflux family